MVSGVTIVVSSHNYNSRPAERMTRQNGLTVTRLNRGGTKRTRRKIHVRGKDERDCKEEGGTEDE